MGALSILTDALTTSNPSACNRAKAAANTLRGDP